MKIIFDQKAREFLIQRINLLDENHQPQWGKMNISQMLKHNIFWNDGCPEKGNILTNKYF